MKTKIKGLAVLLFNAARDRGGDTWGELVWSQATKLYAEHGTALIDALTASDVELSKRDAAHRLADALLATP